MSNIILRSGAKITTPAPSSTLVRSIFQHLVETNPNSVVSHTFPSGKGIPAKLYYYALVNVFNLGCGHIEIELQKQSYRPSEKLRSITFNATDVHDALDEALGMKTGGLHSCFAVNKKNPDDMVFELKMNIDETIPTNIVPLKQS